MPKRNCKHKEKRILQTQKMIREDIKEEDALVEGSVVAHAYENLPSSKESSGWLEAYLDEPTLPVQRWRRMDYKPDKYNNSPQRSNRLPQPKFHRCAKHGIVPLDADDNLSPTPGPEGAGLISSRPTDSRTNSTYDYDYRRYDAVGVNFFEYVPKIVDGMKKLFRLSNKYPRVATTVFAFLFLWWLSSQLESWMSHGAANLVRFGRPAAHWSSVSLEQFANRLRSFATSTDDLVEGFYCDFARSWCHRFEIMCDVRCSFMDKAIQRLRSA